jgi:hypothetical protein
MTTSLARRSLMLVRRARVERLDRAWEQGGSARWSAFRTCGSGRSSDAPCGDAGANDRPINAQRATPCCTRQPRRLRSRTRCAHPHRHEAFVSKHEWSALHVRPRRAQRQCGTNNLPIKKGWLDRTTRTSPSASEPLTRIVLRFKSGRQSGRDAEVAVMPFCSNHGSVVRGDERSRFEAQLQAVAHERTRERRDERLRSVRIVLSARPHNCTEHRSRAPRSCSSPSLLSSAPRRDSSMFRCWPCTTPPRGSWSCSVVRRGSAFARTPPTQGSRHLVAR